MEVICKHLVGWRMLKQFSICQMPEIETDELFLWTSTTAPAEKADPFCQGSLVETVDCKSEFSFWTSGTQKIQSKCSYVIKKKKKMFLCVPYLGHNDYHPWLLQVCGGGDNSFTCFEQKYILWNPHVVHAFSYLSLMSKKCSQMK